MARHRAEAKQLGVALRIVATTSPATQKPVECARARRFGPRKNIISRWQNHLPFRVFIKLYFRTAPTDLEV